jgi:hypothetical protein
MSSIIAQKSKIAKLEVSLKPDRVAGLTNHGNTCFLNSSLQLLCEIGPLVASLRKDLLLGELLRLVARRSHDGCADLTKSVCEIILNIPVGQGRRQQDAAEAIQCMLDKLEEESYSHIGASIVETQRTCVCCGGSSIPADLPPPQWNLINIIPIGKDNAPTSLAQLLRDCNMKESKLDIRCNHNCPNYDCTWPACSSAGCSSMNEEGHRPSTKHSQTKCFAHPKPYVILQLARFHYDASAQAKNLESYEGSKINRYVEASLTIYFSDPLTSSEKDGERYELIAVICHEGSETSHGHYVTIKKVNEQWALFNDDKVTYLSATEMQEKCASGGYIFLYRKDSSQENCRINACTRMLDGEESAAISRSVQLCTLNSGTMINQSIGRYNQWFVTAGSLWRLIPPAWINDEIVNAVGILINQHVASDPTSAPASNYMLSSYFHTKLIEQGVHAVRNWNRTSPGFDFQKLERIAIPMHMRQSHWILGCVDIPGKIVGVIDPFGAGLRYEHQEQKLLSWIQKGTIQTGNDRIGDPKKWRRLPPTSFHFENQQNGSDCGMFTMSFALQWLLKENGGTTCMKREMMTKLRADLWNFFASYDASVHKVVFGPSEHGLLMTTTSK